jgi:uncharacterized membrane protein YeaQ/YmgE (transglycosylase-associated protein family)
MRSIIWILVGAIAGLLAAIIASGHPRRKTT